jgi:hypothetical protein
MSDIFISYATEDRPRAEQIAKALETKGWTVWWDRHIRVGERAHEVIQREVAKARCVVVLWSAVSITKDWVHDEANVGKERQILAPVLVERVKPAMGFRQIQAVDLSEWHGDPNDPAFRKLCDDIASLLSDPETEAYLNALWNLTRHIEIKNLRTSDASANTFAIDELYTPLTTVLPHEPDKKPAVELKRPDVALHQALEQQRLVMVGDPGAGKTTFLRRIAFEACHRLLGRDREREVERMLGDPCPFPILIRAGDLTKHISSCDASTGTLADHCSPEWLFHYLGATYSQLGEDRFRGFFREGCLLLLDGLDEIPGEAARQQMTDLLHRLASGQPRTRIVATSRPGIYGGVTSIPGFNAVKIAPLDDEAIAIFATKWGQAVHPKDPQAAADLTQVLLKEIYAKPEIRRMAENPVMLTALSCLHFTKTSLPEQRSELYDSVLEWLAKARQSKTGLDHHTLLSRLRKLAWAMHTGKRNKRTQIERYEAIGILQADFRNEPEEAGKRQAAERFVREEEVNSGIILNDGERLRFWHQTFQEYLAAVNLAYDEKERRKRLFLKKGSKLHDPDWRETMLLLAGCLKKQGDQPVDELLGSILGHGSKDSLLDCVLRVGLMGALLNDLEAWQYTLPAHLKEKYQADLQRALSVFEKEAARSLPFAARLEAAEAIGRAGDPRLDERVDNWVPVEGGEPSAMGRYPVTVSEYRRFIEAGGYKTEEFWSAAGYGEFTEPAEWSEQLRHPNRPLTGVSWFEASAYCAWRGVRLPTEEEWNCAARCGRESVRYPWGSQEPDDRRANYYHEGSPMAPTPVGMYPEGATPTGIQDLAGNVWEWTTTWYEKDKYRTLRGGAWYSVPLSLRVSVRDSGLPGIRSGYLGFRCVRD